LSGESTGTLAASDLGAEGIEPGAPVLAELVEPLINLSQRSGIDGIKPAGPFGTYGRETGFPEHFQMLRDRRLGDSKLCGDRVHHCAGRMLLDGQELHDPTSDGITQDVKCVHPATLSISTYISQDLFYEPGRPGFRVFRSTRQVVATILMPMSEPDPWATLARVTGAAGLAGIVLIFVPIIAMSSLGEPAFVATREETAAFFRNTAESSWADAAGTVALLGLVALTSFMVGLFLLLRRAEGEPPWRSTVALVFGALFAAYLFTDASWEAAGNRGADLDPGLAHFAFDMGNIGFANAWVSMGSFAAFTGWVVLKTGVFRRWLGWLMVASGVGLALSRFVWTTEAWLVPYALFWIWVVVICVRLLRKPA
jgi:hypothetical protein